MKTPELFRHFSTGQWAILAVVPFTGLAGIGIAVIRLKYNLFWE